MGRMQLTRGSLHDLGVPAYHSFRSISYVGSCGLFEHQPYNFPYYPGCHFNFLFLLHLAAPYLGECAPIVVAQPMNIKLWSTLNPKAASNAASGSAITKTGHAESTKAGIRSLKNPHTSVVPDAYLQTKPDSSSSGLDEA